MTYISKKFEAAGFSLRVFGLIFPLNLCKGSLLSWVAQQKSRLKGMRHKFGIFKFFGYSLKVFLSFFILAHFMIKGEALATTDPLHTTDPLQPYIVYLDWFLNPHHAPLVVGMKKGFFKEQGLEIELVSAGGSEEGSKQVAAGHADLAVSKQSAHLIRVVNQKMPLVRVATLIDRPLECLIAQENITDISALAGKRIGFTSSSIEFATLAIKTLLASKGLSLADVTLVPITGGMPAALLSGQVDAIFSAYRTYELEDIRHHKPNVHVFYYEENGIPSFEQVILVASQDRLHQPQLKKFLMALKQSVVFIKNNPEAAWKLYAEHAPEQNSELNQRVFMKVADLLSFEPEKVHQQRYEKFADFLKSSHILKDQIPPLNSYAQEINLNNG